MGELPLLKTQQANMHAACTLLQSYIYCCMPLGTLCLTHCMTCPDRELEAPHKYANCGTSCCTLIAPQQPLVAAPPNHQTLALSCTAHQLHTFAHRPCLSPPCPSCTLSLSLSYTLAPWIKLHRHSHLLDCLVLGMCIRNVGIFLEVREPLVLSHVPLAG